MEIQSQEARIHLAIAAIWQNRKLSWRTTVKVYNVPYSTLTDRINSYQPFYKCRPAIYKLIELKKEMII